MTAAKLQQLLDAHCQDMKASMPGFLFYGILSTTDLERDKCNIGISRALLYKCKAEFGTMLDDFF